MADLTGLRKLISHFTAAYQLPLSPTQAYGVASQFIISGSCPDDNAALMGAIQAYPRAYLRLDDK